MKIVKKYFLWAILSLPLIGAITQAINIPYTEKEFDQLMHVSGEFGVRLLVISLMITPLSMIFKRTKFAKWLLRNRRYFGVAAFSYMIFHTIVYFIYKSTPEIINESYALRYTVGWLALFMVIPPAITSTNSAIKKLGSKKWKNMQRLAYGVGIFSALHWLLLDGGVKPALVHFTPLIILELYRVIKVNIKTPKLSTT